MPVALRRAVPAVLLALVAPILFAGQVAAADTGSISGTVTARPASGAAAAHAGASIVLDRQNADGFFTNAFATGTSEADGSFDITGLPDGRYQIRTYPSGYVHAEAELGDLGYEYYNDRNGPYGSELVQVTGGAAVTLDSTIELRPIGNVKGRVVDEAGDPVVGSVLVAPGGAGGSSVQTNAQGYYDTLDGEWTQNILPGAYEAYFSPAAYEIGSPMYYLEDKAATVSPGQTTTVDFVLRQRPTATFTVLDTDGSPLANAPVQFLTRDDGGEWLPPQSGPHQTDAQGRYRFTDGSDEIKVGVGLPEGYAGTGVPEWWDDAPGSEGAAILTFPEGVALDRQFTIRLAPATTPTPTTPTPTTPAPTTPTTPPVTTTPPVVGKLTSVRPRVTGKAIVGRSLKVAAGAWRPAPVRLTYQWLRNGKPIKGRTAGTYRLTKADLGKRISVRVTGRKASYAATTAISRPTPKVRRR